MINKQTRPSFSAYSTPSQTVNHKLGDGCKSGPSRTCRRDIFIAKLGIDRIAYCASEERSENSGKSRKIQGRYGFARGVG